MKKALKRSLVITLVAVLLIGTFAVTADAAMKRTVKLKTFTTTSRVVNKAASKVKKGTTTLVFPKSEGFLKFVAPATKTYSFTFSNLKDKKDTYGFVKFLKKKKHIPGQSDDFNDLKILDIATKGGKDECLYIASTGLPEDNTGPVISRYLHKRTGKIKLRKGEVLYIFYSGRAGVKLRKNTMKLVIK